MINKFIIMKEKVIENWCDSSKQPILVTILLVYIAALWLEYRAGVLTKETFSGYSIFILLFASFIVYRERMFKRHLWLYFAIQGIFIFDCAIIMDKGFESVFIGLIPILIYECMLVYEEKGYVLLATFLYYGMFTVIIFIKDGVNAIINYLPALGLITFAEWMFYSMYRNQLELRVKAQKMMRELEQANIKLEELAIEKERERVARDLHDTLSQGLSALVLQMEAIRANIVAKKWERAEDIALNGAEHARKALSESREVLLKLRQHNQEKMDLKQAILYEIERFQSVYHGELNLEMAFTIQVEKPWIRQIGYVVRESFNNIVRHAKARTVELSIYDNEEYLLIKITDDGVGFNSSKTLRKAGHFGLLGMEERTRALGGELTVHSIEKKGTTIEIRVPIQKEENQ